MYAQKCVTPNGVRLISKLRADPKNIFVKMPDYDAYLFTDSQISRITNFLSTSIGVDRILGTRSCRYTTQPCQCRHSEMLAAGAVGY